MKIKFKNGVELKDVKHLSETYRTGDTNLTISINADTSSIDSLLSESDDAFSEITVVRENMNDTTLTGYGEPVINKIFENDRDILSITLSKTN